jgi:hypothetical protein
LRQLAGASFDHLVGAGEQRPANTLSRYHHEISCVSAYLIMAASVSGPTMPSMSPW